MTHAKPSDPDDPTRPKRLALDAAREYYRISREHSTYDVGYARMAALQGILRLLIYVVGGDEDGWVVQPD
jgi:hypothetical protein